jgi:hypothetical protein
MTQKVYTVYDSKAEAYLRPFFVSTKGLALRSMVDAVNDPQHPFNKYPEDYTLFEIGEWDDSNGTIKMHKAHESIGVAIEYIENNQNPNRDRSNTENRPEIVQVAEKGQTAKEGWPTEGKQQ